MDRGAWQATVQGLQRWTWLGDFHTFQKLIIE